MSEDKERDSAPRKYFKAEGELFQGILDMKREAGLVPVLYPLNGSEDPRRAILWYPIEHTRPTGCRMRLRGCIIDERVA